MSIESKSDWGARLDEVKAAFGLESEVQLAALIGISPTVLASTRTGRTQLSLKARFMVMDKLGYALTRDLILELLPEDAQKVVRDIDSARAKKTSSASRSAGRKSIPRAV